MGVGMAAVIAVLFVRRAATTRRMDLGLPVKNTRRNRKIERTRARAAARWVRDNAEQARAVLAASDKASTQLSMWDNARRTSHAYLDSARVVGASIGPGASSMSRSDPRALRTKVDELHADAAPHLRAAATAESELAKLQVQLNAYVKRLRGQAPVEVVALAQRLVEAHDTARKPMGAHLDEVRARQRLDRLTELRESLELMIARLVDRQG